jgi:hypothetical protein
VQDILSVNPLNVVDIKTIGGIEKLLQVLSHTTPEEEKVRENSSAAAFLYFFLLFLSFLS